MDTTIITLNEGDKLAIPFSSRRFGMQDHHFQIGSVAGYAAAHGEDVDWWIDRAQRLGHQLHYVSSLGFTITAHAQEPVEYIHLELGQEVEFDGLRFILTEDNNQNVKLVPASGDRR